MVKCILVDFENQCGPYSLLRIFRFHDGCIKIEHCFYFLGTKRIDKDTVFLSIEDIEKIIEAEKE